MTEKSIYSIMVTYNPEIERVASILERLKNDTRTVVCDNSTDDRLRKAVKALTDGNGDIYLCMNGNVGIARAQNEGILLAQKYGAHFVFLIDDDSIPEPGLPNRLMQTYQKMTSSGLTVGVVGARALNSKGLDISNAALSTKEVSICTNLMSSGSLIPVSVFNEIGLMDEALFIDCVDYDWGWRAQNRGYKIYLFNNGFIKHSPGESTYYIYHIKLGIPVPVRHYYQYRNILTMMTRNYVPFTWKIKQVFSLGLKLFFFPLFVKPRHARLRYMLHGIKDWVTARDGKIVSGV